MDQGQRATGELLVVCPHALRHAPHHIAILALRLELEWTLHQQRQEQRLVLARLGIRDGKHNLSLRSEAGSSDHHVAKVLHIHSASRASRRQINLRSPILQIL